ncbi:hypothetical protein ECPA49_4391, partial [Escherichia coli PA49]
MSTVFSLSLPG